MNIAFLKKVFETIPTEKVEIAVSNINAYRNFIGNGVAVGKLAEVIIAQMFTNEPAGIHGFSFAFTGKNPPFDIMVYSRRERISRSTFTDLRGLYQESFLEFCRGIDACVGSDQWCGISLKNYLNEESQLTTNYGIRTLCEEMLGDEFVRHSDPAEVKLVLDRAKRELSHETILLLNSFPAERKYQFRLFSLDSINITSIEYTKKAKHTRYVFNDQTGAVFHVKYGKNQANPFQRGLWVDNLEKLPLLHSGKYKESAFGSYLLDGALIHHEPKDTDLESLSMGEHGSKDE